VDLTSHVTILGGAASRAVIVERCGRLEFDRAVREGILVRVARGRYALATASQAVVVAATWGGVLAMRSAAQRHGWGQKLVPEKPDVCFPRNHRVDPEARKVLVPHWLDIDEGDVEAGVTTKRRTLIDCLRNLPVDESLPIVDSALRADDLTYAELQRLAHGMKGRGRTRAMAVARLASSKPPNPYESTLRGLAAQVAGLTALPQHPVKAWGRTLHPDLFDPGLGLVIEAESFQWHGKTAALTRDCLRYNAFALVDLTVIRFSWYQVMFQPEYVVDVLVRCVERAREHANVARGPTVVAA
jgi:hypothetical protein